MKMNTSARVLVLSVLFTLRFSLPCFGAPPASLADDVWSSLRGKRDVEATAVSSHGTVSALHGNLGALPIHGKALTDADLAPLLTDIGGMFRLRANELRLHKTRNDPDGSTHLYLQQQLNGLDVVGGTLSLHVKQDGTVYAAFGHAFGGDSMPAPSQATVSASSAILAALAGHTANVSVSGTPALSYIITSRDLSKHLAWRVTITGNDGRGPVDGDVFVDALSGAVVDVHPSVFFAINRTVYMFPPNPTYQIYESETQSPPAPPISAYSTNFLNLLTAYDLHGHAAGEVGASNLYDTIPMHAYVNMPDGVFSFWEHQPPQNDIYMFNNTDLMAFSGPLNTTSYQTGDWGTAKDIVIHESTHGVTWYTSHLDYSAEPGALNESFSDVCAVWGTWLSDGQTFNSGTWKLGESILNPAQIQVRNLADPPTDAITLSNGTVVKSVDFYDTTFNVNNDVHYNSGIPNLAFYLLSMGGTHPEGKTNIPVTGIGIDAAGKIFYRAFTTYVAETSQFYDARAATVQAAIDLGYSTQSVNNAWDAVGVPSAVTNTHAINLSTRANVGTGNNVMIAGFVLARGTSSKAMLLRGVGPTLAEFGVSGLMANPQITLYSGGNVIASNDNWGSAASNPNVANAAARDGAFALPDGSADSALWTSLAPGAYSMILSGVNNTTGNAMVELYDDDQTNPTQLVNISTRAYATPSSPVIAGFNIAGTSYKRLLIRVGGPSVPGITGALADPAMNIYDSHGNLLRTNDDWWSPSTGVAEAAQLVGAFPYSSGSHDAGTVIDLPPGAYTVQGYPFDNTSSGLVLVEVYDVTGTILK